MTQPVIKVARTARAFLCLIDLSKDFTGVKIVAIFQSHTAKHAIKRIAQGNKVAARYNENSMVAFLVSAPISTIGRPSDAVAKSFGISLATASKWLDRVQDSGRVSGRYNSATGQMSYASVEYPKSTVELNAASRVLKEAGVVNIKTLRARRVMREKMALRSN